MDADPQAWLKICVAPFIVPYPYGRCQDPPTTKFLEFSPDLPLTTGGSAWYNEGGSIFLYATLGVRIHLTTFGACCQDPLVVHKVIGL